jgi:hypothetical protein
LPDISQAERRRSVRGFEGNKESEHADFTVTESKRGAMQGTEDIGMALSIIEEISSRRNLE